MALRPFDVNSSQALLALLDIVSYFVILPEFFARCRNVYKHIFAAIIGFDKAEAFTLIKKFDGSCGHCDQLKVWLKDARSGQITKQGYRMVRSWLHSWLIGLVLYWPLGLVVPGEKSFRQAL